MQKGKVAGTRGIPRPEHPRPQFMRETWKNLNGTWTFVFDPGQSGMERGLAASRGFDREIRVPFCPESRLSGVAHTDFIGRMWYHREVAIPRAWDGRRILLHFGAVDFACEAFIDGQPVGTHVGGSSSFTFDITAQVQAGKRHHLVLHVQDDTRSGAQAGGKQSVRHASHGCSYTRVTGIWQTVWLEAVAPGGLEQVQVMPDLDGGRFVVVPRYRAVARGLRLRARLFDGKRKVDEVVVPVGQNAACALSAGRKSKAWSPESPFLYDLTFEVLDGGGHVLDLVRSYAGLRKVHVEGGRVYLNNQPRFLRLVLDQGFYPEGIWTAPTDRDLRRDIEMSMRAGFNGARLHQKVFEERFHYWADRLGYLTWGESASWGLVFCSWYHTMPANRHVPFEAGALNFLTEWREVITRDRNHPSIIAWSPFNETGGGYDAAFHDRILRAAYDLTRDLDPTRPVNDTSGYVHVHTDLWTVHNYEQDPEKLRTLLTPGAEGVWRNNPKRETAYGGQPYLVDEFGGIRWTPPDKREKLVAGWGYGQEPRTLEDFYARLKGQVDALLSLKHVAGYCYTQLTDVEQEQNGVYYYDRTRKFDMARIARIFRRDPE